MGRFIVLVIIVLAAIWLVKRALRSSGDRDVREKPPQGEQPMQGDLVACARCGLNLPRAEASESAGVLFCSPEHARLGKS